MTDVTLTIGSNTFTFYNGEVDSVTSDISATPDADPMPGFPPGQAFMMDLNGASKTITITGSLFETTDSRVNTSTVKTILAQKYWLESLVNGNQTYITFTSNYESYTLSSSDTTPASSYSADSTTKVMVRSMRFTENTGNPELLDFTITFATGAA